MLEIDNKRKRLLYRSLHRGCKEIDILLGGFATQYLFLLSDEEINAYEKIVDIDDKQLYDYITGKQLIPSSINHMMKYIISFNKEKFKFN
ncbi:succinate dehydrogenase assembly factor 2 [Neoehrlichia mikurensis]|uniref:Succinate dehydrogenase assembly factor 2 n=1 Tax=Neoehrlichia mikurensis TaxID=89586 RepID=A0A9Q9BVM4_9RICK|nr:succinate dehydrogenase assembly factor 2 [Neoehrlichia mikurensis]QXK91630.1 succinate dehydrogenase assembly factor 2 [Neoehrlichia mikurensis]QXK92841.1 succinate dehydrogenase assembly factor 2 [Neoehrlichia mikurensis]QXK93321.1 succinate dehydrogenase assembly factor 2 [Neoehrlichia mikurensis]UTO55736.1 succinate dehydrogenase assembly factor 2 [Neoehrlichia mikurensis]UTO56653.1 succinate dehydrogenase assembly factor 2 [Neoehrlichia mikurensis]